MDFGGPGASRGLFFTRSTLPDGRVLIDHAPRTRRGLRMELTVLLAAVVLTVATYGLYWLVARLMEPRS